MKPYPPEKMDAHDVSIIVNSAKYDGPDCIQPVSDDERPNTGLITVTSLIVFFALIGCSTVNTGQPNCINVFPRDTDPKMRAFIEQEFLQIIVVTESPEWRPTVTLEHIGRGWVGVTYGASDIRIEPSLVQTAMTNEAALWALRRTIAHEIGHAMSGHRFTTAAMQQAKELEADAKGIEYFKRLGWSCKLWVDNFARGLKRGFNIDAEHDSKARYDQALRLCSTA